MSNQMHIFGSLIIAILFLGALSVISFGQDGLSPLEYLKQQELQNRGKRGEIYLGKVIAILYPPYSLNPETEYFPFLLELTDILKSPLRKNYRLLIKGYTDNTGDARDNIEISAKRAENLKKILMEKYFMKADRITAEGHGAADTVASNETIDGRRRNRRVEIHVYGDVSEAVKFIDR